MWPVTRAESSNTELSPEAASKRIPFPRAAEQAAGGAGRALATSQGTRVPRPVSLARGTLPGRPFQCCLRPLCSHHVVIEHLLCAGGGCTEVTLRMGWDSPALGSSGDVVKTKEGGAALRAVTSGPALTFMEELIFSEA